MFSQGPPNAAENKDQTTGLEQPRTNLEQTQTKTQFDWCFKGILLTNTCSLNVNLPAIFHIAKQDFLWGLSYEIIPGRGVGKSTNIVQNINQRLPNWASRVYINLQELQMFVVFKEHLTAINIWFGSLQAEAVINLVKQCLIWIFKMKSFLPVVYSDLTKESESKREKYNSRLWLFSKYISCLHSFSWSILVISIASWSLEINYRNILPL